MENKYKLVLSNKKIYKEVELPEESRVFRIGTTVECDYRLSKEYFFEDVRLELISKDGRWYATCSDNLYFDSGEAGRIITKELVHGDGLTICYSQSSNELLKMEFMVDFDSKYTNLERRIEFGNKRSIFVGGDQDNDIVLKGPYVRNDRIELIKEGNEFRVKIVNTAYGVNHNGSKIESEKKINNGDFVSIANFLFYCKDNYIWMKIDSDYSIRNLNYRDQTMKANYPKFIRNTRIKSKIDDKPIKVLDPVAIPEKPPLNLVTTLMPAVVMFALVIVLRGVMSESSGTYVIFSICTMGMGVVTAVLNIVNRQKKYQKDCEDRINTYQTYLINKRDEIQKARELELWCLRTTHYNTEENLQHLQKFDSCLFDKTPEDDDFLEIYLGIGWRKSEKKIDYKEQEKLEVGDELSQMPSQVAREFKYIANAPITLSLKGANAVGVIGTYGFLNDMLKEIAVDLISRHYYGDLNIYVFMDEETEKYEWVRMIPHFQYGDLRRNIVCDTQSKNNVFENLYKELTLRSENKGIDGYNVVLIMDDQGIKSHPISRFIEKAAELNTVFVFFESKEELLPLHCSQIIKMDVDSCGILYKSEDRTKVQKFTYTKVSDYILGEISRIIAPTYCEEISLEGSMRKTMSLFELLEIYSVEDLNLEKRWDESKIYESMAVPLGINAKEEVVTLNLHEKYHGPHGLVAGTTGSGKSEILQAYILSAATIFHPYEIGFVIIDFKGGGMVNQFKDLPHLIGAITNIDGNEVQRSLKSIKAELVKRQNYFALAGVNHIDKYIQLYKEGKVGEALPHLVIIVDEFAELKAEQPEFMKELISAARIGRSLGVHLILATQKPSGVVDAQIWSNSKFKLCLKVQSKEDSNEVLKTPLAAEIKEPGRAYLQVGNNEIFELFQSAYSGAPASADDSETKKAFTIKQVSFSGARTAVYEKKKKVNKTIYDRNQLEAVVEFVKGYCEKSQIDKLPNICLPPLETHIVYENSEIEAKHHVQVGIGIYDYPEQQLQSPYVLNLTTTNYIIIGSAQTGKTNILQTVIRGIAENYSVKEVNIYVLDFGSMILKNFSDLNQVGGVVYSHEDEKLKSFFRMLNEEVVERKARLSEAGVSSFASYKEAGREDLPQIVVVIDNLTALKELYLQEEDMLLPLCRDGVAVGISFVIANLQTAGISYRYLNSFEGRIALFCNETSEYTMLFEGNRMKISNNEGRSLVQIEKTAYECQMYLSFEGEKEFERVQAIKEFVGDINSTQGKEKAKRIPEIPQRVTQEYLEINYPEAYQEEEIVLGLDFKTVLPSKLNLTKNKLLTIVGQKESNMRSFAKRLVNEIKDRVGGCELYIVDEIAGNWSEFEYLQETAFYSTSTDSSLSIFNEISYTLKRRYEELSTKIIDNLNEEPWIVLVIDSDEAINGISKDKASVECFKEIIGKYAEMKVFVLFCNVPNNNISFNSPELLKCVKDNKHYIVFEDMQNIKLVDIPISVSKKFKKQVKANDAYMIVDSEVVKIRTIV